MNIALQEQSKLSLFLSAHKIRKHFCHNLVAVVVLLTAWALSADGKSPRPYITAVTRPVRSIDPFRPGHTSPTMLRFVTERLVNLAESSSDTLVPELATSWELSSDKRSVVFELRRNVQWHDGKPFTAEDVRYSWEAYQDQFKTERPPGLEGIVGVEIINPNRVRIILRDNHYNSFFAGILSLRIYPQHIYKDSTPQSRDQLLMGTGPYKFHRFQKNKRVELERFESWWGNLDPSKSNMYLIPAIAFRFAEDTTVAIQMIRQKQLDAFILLTEKDTILARNMIAGDPKLKIVSGPIDRGVTLHMELNLREGPLRDKRVRKALNLLWDREFVNTKLFNGEYGISQSTFLRSASFFKETMEFRFNRERAIQLLAEAGWKDSDKDGWLDSEIDGKRMPLELTIKSGHQNLESILTLYQEFAKKIGVKINIQPIDRTSIWETVEEGRFQIFAHLILGADSVDDFSYRSGRKENTSGVASKDIDELLDKLAKEYNLSKRRKLSRELQQKIDGEVPYIYGFEANAVSYVTSARTIFPEGKNRAVQKYWAIQE